LNHTINDFWEEGGGNHANAPSWVKKSNRDNSKKRQKKDKAYVSKDDSGSETAPIASNSTSLQQADKLLIQLTGHVEDGYISYISREPANKKGSIAWNLNTMCQLIIEEIASVSTINTPFCFDTGATSHILLFVSDFIRLTHMEPKDICGVNGASIPAIRTSILKFQCRKGRDLL